MPNLENNFHAQSFKLDPLHHVKISHSKKSQDQLDERWIMISKYEATVHFFPFAHTFPHLIYLATRLQMFSPFQSIPIFWFSCLHPTSPTKNLFIVQYVHSHTQFKQTYRQSHNTDAWKDLINQSSAFEIALYDYGGTSMLGRVVTTTTTST